MRRLTAGIALLSLATLGACKPAPGPVTDADRAVAASMDSAFAAAATAGDVSGMMAGYAPNAMVMPPDMAMAQGSEQIHGLWNTMAGAAKVTLTLKQQTADGSGDFMYTTGTYHLQPMPEGSAPAVDGKYLEVFHRGTDGKWMIVADSWSPNTAPLPPAVPEKKPARRGR